MKRYSFKKEQKLRREEEFKCVFKNGSVFKVNVFKAYYLENGKNISRLGVSVSRRTGNAVFRNRIKRITREWFRLNCLHFTKPVDIVFIFNRKIPSFTNKNLRMRLEEFLFLCLRK